jgi:hypothetical protein
VYPSTRAAMAMAALTQGKNRSMSPFSDAKQSALDESGAIKGLMYTRSRATAGMLGWSKAGGPPADAVLDQLCAQCGPRQGSSMKRSM